MTLTEIERTEKLTELVEETRQEIPPEVAEEYGNLSDVSVVQRIVNGCIQAGVETGRLDPDTLTLSIAVALSAFGFTRNNQEEKA